MGLDVMIHLVKGYKIPLENIVKEMNTEEDNCSCNTNNDKYCPTCGTEVGKKTIYNDKQLLKNLSPGEDWGSLKSEDIYFQGVISNCNLDDEESYVMLGIKVGEMVNMYESALREVKGVSKEEVDGKIKAFVEKHEVNLKGSKFGLFYIQSCW